MSQWAGKRRRCWTGCWMQRSVYLRVLHLCLHVLNLDRHSMNIGSLEPRVSFTPVLSNLRHSQKATRSHRVRNLFLNMSCNDRCCIAHGLSRLRGRPPCRRRAGGARPAPRRRRRAPDIFRPAHQRGRSGRSGRAVSRRGVPRPSATHLMTTALMMPSQVMGIKGLRLLQSLLPPAAHRRLSRFTTSCVAYASFAHYPSPTVCRSACSRIG